MRIVLYAVLMLFTVPAIADWVKFTENEDYHHYIDDATIRRDGNMRRVWMLQNLKSSKLDWKSQRYFIEVDCKEGRQRTLETTMHSELMAKGKVVLTGNDKPSGWRNTAPGSTSEALFKLVCSK